MFAHIFCFTLMCPLIHRVNSSPAKSTVLVFSIARAYLIILFPVVRAGRGGRARIFPGLAVGLPVGRSRLGLVGILEARVVLHLVDELGLRVVVGPLVLLAHGELAHAVPHDEDDRGVTRALRAV